MAYTRVNWEDLPSTNTPRNATNLNKMDSAIKEHDDELIGAKSMGNVIVESIESKNKFDKNTALKNAWLSDSGQINVYTNDNLVSGYIPVKPNTTYTASGYYANKYLKICGYNSNKEFTQVIIDINSSQTYQTITTGSNDYFIRVGFGDSVLTADTLQFEKGSVVTSYSPYQNLDGKETYSIEETRIGTWEGKPLYRKMFIGTFEGGTYTTITNILPLTCEVRKIGGSTIQSSGNRRTLPFILVSSGVSYYISPMAAKNTSNNRWDLTIFYSSDYNTQSYEVFVEYTKN